MQVTGGTIEPTKELVQYMTSDGIKSEPRYVATSEHNNESADFALRSTAEYWLGLINDHYEWLERRKAIFG